MWGSAIIVPQVGLCVKDDVGLLALGAFQFWGKLAIIYEVECLTFASVSVSGHAASSLGTF